MSSTIAMSASIVVVGSVNMDVTVRVAALAARGETVSGSDAELLLGGKGANQAIAAHRLGARVRFIACVGDDTFGISARESLARYGLDLETVFICAGAATGIAMIAVDQDGQNAITLSPGANARLAVSDLEIALSSSTQRDILLLQNEVPPDVSRYAAAAFRAKGRLVIVDPAPAQNFDSTIIASASIITPNETEAAALTGLPIRNMAEAFDAARWLVKAGAATALIKMGASGVVFAGKHGDGHVRAKNVLTVDTVAAGDCFNGALAVALGEGNNFLAAVEFACAAAAISVTRQGAAASMPSRNDIIAMG
jgi:ribokinase